MKKELEAAQNCIKMLRASWSESMARSKESQRARRDLLTSLGLRRRAGDDVEIQLVVDEVGFVLAQVTRNTGRARVRADDAVGIDHLGWDHAEAFRSCLEHHVVVHDAFDLIEAHWSSDTEMVDRAHQKMIMSLDLPFVCEHATGEDRDIAIAVRDALEKTRRLLATRAARDFRSKAM